MTAAATIRPVSQDDITVIERFAADFECIQWGGLSNLNARLLADRWQKTEITPSFIQVADTEFGLRGYSDAYRVSQHLSRFQGLAVNLEVAASLIDVTGDRAVREGITLQTSLSTTAEGQSLYARFVDHPLYRTLSERGYGQYSTTTVMRLLKETDIRQVAIPNSYQFVHLNESLLPSLMTTYYAAWPRDYYEGEDHSEIVEIFRQAHPDDLRLITTNLGDVAGYVLSSRTSNLGEIDEVAVHPSHRRKGLGRALTESAIQNLGDRTISLVVMDENPARNLYENLGFVVWDERIDLIFARG